MEQKKNDAWVPGPDDTLDSLVGKQQQVLKEFAKFSGDAFPGLPKIPSAVVEVDHTEVVEQSANGSMFVKVVRKIFGKNGNGDAT